MLAASRTERDLCKQDHFGQSSNNAEILKLQILQLEKQVNALYGTKIANRAFQQHQDRNYADSSTWYFATRHVALSKSGGPNESKCIIKEAC